MTDSPSARHRWHFRKAGESPDGSTSSDAARRQGSSRQNRRPHRVTLRCVQGCRSTTFAGHLPSRGSAAILSGRLRPQMHPRRLQRHPHRRLSPPAPLASEGAVGGARAWEGAFSLVAKHGSVGRTALPAHQPQPVTGRIVQVLLEAQIPLRSLDRGMPQRYRARAVRLRGNSYRLLRTEPCPLQPGPGQRTGGYVNC